MPHNEKKETKTDLRHDTMEFSASTDGDDQLDEEDDIFAEEENDISSEELDVLGDAADAGRGNNVFYT